MGISGSLFITMCRRGALALLILLLILAWPVIWLRVRDPLSALPRTETAHLVADRQQLQNGRTLRYLALDGGAVGEIHAILSLPRPLPEERKLPVMVVLGGLSARENLQYLPDPGPNAVLLYDWPFSTYLPDDMGKILQAAPGYYRNIGRMPGQVAALMAWTRSTSWADPKRFSLVGISLGAMAVPAAQRVAERQGIIVPWTVMAYGGSPIGEVLVRHPAFSRWPAKPLVRVTLNLLTRHIDPGEHLPHLKGRFLVIYGLDDQMVPLRASRRLLEITPVPKRAIALQGRHLGIWRQDEIQLLHEISTLTRQWLIDQGAVADSARHTSP